MLRFYGLDLVTDLGTPRLTWRRLRVLVERLPRSSALVRETEGSIVDWSTSDYLLARIATTLEWANWQRGGGKGDKPKPITPPKSKTEEERRHGALGRLVGRLLDQRERRLQAERR